jgi:GNAT superfamily N-acetyltransferase
VNTQTNNSQSALSVDTRKNIKYRIEQLNVKTANDTLLDKFFHHHETIFMEANPDDPLFSRSRVEKQILDSDPYYEYFRWMVLLDNETDDYIGYGILTITTEQSPEYESNQHIAWINISVNKDYRRKGIATSVFKTIVKKVEELGRKTIEVWTSHDAGKNACKRLGGALSYQGYRNRLQYDEIDWNLMDEWIREGKTQAKGVSIEQFSDVPEKDIAEYVQLYTETANQAPLEEVESRDQVTPQSRRHKEIKQKEYGSIWITKISRESNGTISGLTEIFYLPEEPHRVNQELTGVKEEYRGRGLGKWLKAEMLLYIKENFPQIKYIETGNAQSNAPMLSINHRMGYKEYRSGHMYKFKLI